MILFVLYILAVFSVATGALNTTACACFSGGCAALNTHAPLSIWGESRRRGVAKKVGARMERSEKRAVTRLRRVRRGRIKLARL